MQLPRCVPAMLFLLLAVPGFSVTASDQPTAKEGQLKNTALINENVYSNIFLRQRAEQKTLVQHILSRSDDYAKQYKLLQVGLHKILETISAQRTLLESAGYHPSAGFPRTEATIDAFAAIAENTCLFADLVLHTPEMSRKALQRQAPGLGNMHWQRLIDWATAFVGHFHGVVIDEGTREMLALFEQEINPDRRTAEYVNPYHSANKKRGAEDAAEAKRLKVRRKMRKGPQLGGGGSHSEL